MLVTFRLVFLVALLGSEIFILLDFPFWNSGLFDPHRLRHPLKSILLSVDKRILFLVFQDQGDEAILNHVLSSIRIESLHDFAPPLSTYNHVLYQCPVLLFCPTLVVNLLV